MYICENMEIRRQLAGVHSFFTMWVCRLNLGSQKLGSLLYPLSHLITLPDLNLV